MIKVLMVCLGNICRSPTAEGVLRAKLRRHPLAKQVSVDSAGTAAWHIGKAPDSRSQLHARKRGIELSGLRARQVSAADFLEFDYILAMDSENLSNLQAITPKNSRAQVALLLSFAPRAETLDVPDPYYGDGDGFEKVLDLIESAVDGFLPQLMAQHSAGKH